MVLLFIRDLITQSSNNNEGYIERIAKVGFRTKSAARDWAARLIAKNYTEKVPNSQGYRGNRYRVDKVIINYNEATSENLEMITKIFR